MSKLSLFTLILGITAITVMAEFFANDYLQVNLSDNLFGEPKANKEIAQIFDARQLNSPDKQKNALNNIPKPRTATNLIKEKELKESGPKTETAVNTSLPSNSLIAIKDLREAGFFDPYISPVSPIKKIFGVLDVSSQSNAKLIQSQIMEDNSSVAILQEFQFKSSIDANEFYNLVKSKGTEASYFDVNETNGYGEQSFYLNHLVNKDQVFIVTRRQNRVLALTYVRSLHSKFKTLLLRKF